LNPIQVLQERFDSGSIKHKTMKGMDKAARLAMLPEYQIFSVDLTEGTMYYAVIVRNM
jgi:hypothetical protein